MTDAALLVFAKVPEPGQVKTRLTTAYSPAYAAELYEAFLLDALDQYDCLGVDVRLHFPQSSATVPAIYQTERWSVHQQRGNGLGERMLNAVLDAFGAGYRQVVLIGTDHPTLPLPFLEQAIITLQQPKQMVIGPSDDGGYYALGMNEAYPQLFIGLTYSHAQVFEQAMERAMQTAAAVTVLPPWYDVDTPADVERLKAELRALPDGQLPRTRTVLSQLDTA
ncbi:MAG: TIGR04282 family arsenosugar biosynthesis glycosyltransferase [Rhodothermales bacterium]